MCEWHDWRSGMALSWSEHVLIQIGCVREAGAKLRGNSRGKNGKVYQPSNNYIETTQQRANEVLHPTAYSSACSSLRFRRRVSLVVTSNSFSDVAVG